jgi:hypothetical protein
VYPDYISSRGAGRRSTKMHTFQITKSFTSGLLAGLTTTEISSVFIPAGLVVAKSSTTPSAYVVLDCKKVEVG